MTTASSGEDLEEVSTQIILIAFKLNFVSINTIFFHGYGQIQGIKQLKMGLKLILKSSSYLCGFCSIATHRAIQSRTIQCRSKNTGSLEQLSSSFIFFEVPVRLLLPGSLATSPSADQQQQRDGGGHWSQLGRINMGRCLWSLSRLETMYCPTEILDTELITLWSRARRASLTFASCPHRSLSRIHVEILHELPIHHYVLFQTFFAWLQLHSAATDDRSVPRYVIGENAHSFRPGLPSSLDRWLSLLPLRQQNVIGSIVKPGRTGYGIHIYPENRL